MPAAPVDARVSVALCTYNGEAFLGEQLASVARQTVLPGEIVISDDGSTDGYVGHRRAVRRDVAGPGALPANPTALGVTRNFERAIRATVGDLVVLSDQDDVWRPDRLERALAAFDARPELQLVCSDARLVGADGARSAPPSSPRCRSGRTSATASARATRSVCSCDATSSLARPRCSDVRSSTRPRRSPHVGPRRVVGDRRRITRTDRVPG